MSQGIVVKDVSGLAVISGFQSQAEALQLCGHLQNFGVKTTIATAAVGYQVTVYALGTNDVFSLLGLFGIKAAKQ